MNKKRRRTIKYLIGIILSLILLITVFYFIGIIQPTILGGVSWNPTSASLIEETQEYRKYSTTWSANNPSGSRSTNLGSEFLVSQDPMSLPGEQQINVQGLQTNTYFTASKYEIKGLYCVVDFQSSNERIGNVVMKTSIVQCKVNIDPRYGTGPLYCNFNFDASCIDPTTNLPTSTNANFYISTIHVEAPIYKSGYNPLAAIQNLNNLQTIVSEELSLSPVPEDITNNVEVPIKDVVIIPTTPTSQQITSTKNNIQTTTLPLSPEEVISKTKFGVMSILIVIGVSILIIMFIIVIILLIIRFKK